MILRAAAFLLLLASSAALSEVQLALVEPKGSPLTLTKVQRDNDLFAEFKGQIHVSGTLIGEWVAGADNTVYKSPDYVIVLDRKSRTRLPHFSRYVVREVQIKNGQEALQMAAGHEAAERLEKRRVRVVKATGSFVISEYVVGVECDAPWARATVVEAQIPTPMKFAGLNRPEGC